MNSEEACPASRIAASRPPRQVTLSPWVNERFPPWEQLLSAHDVARITRRPRWLLVSLVLLGHFPRKRRYHGRGIGWLRSEVVDWLSKELDAEGSCQGNSESSVRRRISRQMYLPLECANPCAARKRRDVCSAGSKCPRRTPSV